MQKKVQKSLLLFSVGLLTLLNSSKSTMESKEQGKMYTQIQLLLRRYASCQEGHEISSERLLLLLQGYPLRGLCVPVDNQKKNQKE